MSCENNGCSSIVVARPPASVEMDWPWPSWFRDISPAFTRMWQKRRERQALLQLDYWLLDDVGVSREGAEREASKWFWQ